MTGTRHIPGSVLRIGMPVAELRERIGEGKAMDSAHIAYTCGRGIGPDEPFLVRHENGVVTGITFTRYEG